MRSNVDNKSPQSYPHMNNNTSHPQNKQRVNRKREIEVENYALLKRMMGIINRSENSYTPTGVNNRSQQNPNYQQALPGGGILAFSNQPTNNMRNKSLDRYQSYSQLSSSPMAPQEPSGPSLVKVGSMNYFKRKADILEINRNNKQFLKSLNKVQSTMKRDNLKNHQDRINKLKNHLVNVRYGQQSNFIYPLSPSSENHNFNSSRFLFVKNPSIINIHYPSSTRNSQKIRRRKSDLVSMGNYLNNTQKYFNGSMRVQSPKVASRSVLGDEHNQMIYQETQKLKNARRGGNHQRVFTAQSSPIKTKKSKKQSKMYEAFNHSHQQSEFDNTRMKEDDSDMDQSQYKQQEQHSRDRSRIIDEDGNTFSQDQVNLRINNNASVFSMTQPSSNQESQKKNVSYKKVKKELKVEANVVAIDIQPIKTHPAVQVNEIIQQKALKIANDIKRPKVIEIQESQKNSTPLSKRKLVSSYKFVKPSASKQDEQLEETKVNLDIQQQILQNKEESSSKIQEEVKYQIMINNLNEQTKKMIDTLGQKLQEEIQSKLKSNMIAQLNSNNLLNVQNPSGQDLDDIKFTQAKPMNLSQIHAQEQQLQQAQQNQIISSLKQLKELQNKQQIKGIDNPNVQWYLQKLKGLIHYVKNQELVKKQEEKNELKKYNMTSFIGQMAVSMNKPAFYKSKTKLMTEPLKYSKKSNLPKAFLENDCVKLYLARLINLAQEQVIQKQNNQTDYSYKFDQQTLTINQSESQQTVKSGKAKLEKKITKITKKTSKLFIDNNVQRFLDKLIRFAKESKQQIINKTIAKHKREQADYEEYSDAEYSEKFESIQVNEQINPSHLLIQQLAQGFSLFQTQKTSQTKSTSLDDRIEKVQWFIDKLKKMVFQTKKQMKEKDQISDYYNNVSDFDQSKLQSLRGQSEQSKTDTLMNVAQVHSIINKNVIETSKKLLQTGPQTRVASIQQNIRKNLKIKEYVQKYIDKLIGIANRSKISREDLDKVHKAKQAMEQLAKTQKANIIIKRQVKKYLNKKQVQKQSTLPEAIIEQDNQIQISEPIDQNIKSDFQLLKALVKYEQMKQASPQISKTLSTQSVKAFVLKLIRIAIQSKISYSELKQVHDEKEKQVSDLELQRASQAFNIKQPIEVLVKQNIRNKVRHSIQLSQSSSIMFDNIHITLEILNGKNGAIQEAEKALDRLMRNKKLIALKNRSVQKLVLKIFKLAHRSKIQVTDRDQYILKRKIAKGIVSRIQKIQAERILQSLVTSSNVNVERTMNNLHAQRFVLKLLNIVIKSKIKSEKLEKFRERSAIYEVKRKFAKGFIKKLLRMMAEERLKILITANKDLPTLRDKNVQKFILKMLMISIRSRIPLRELTRIKEKRLKVMVLKRFASGFAQRIVEMVSQGIMEKLISNKALKGIQNPNVCRFVLKLLRISIRSRITVADLLKLRIQKGIMKIKRHFAEGFALRLQQKVSEQYVKQLVLNKQLKAIQNPNVQKLVLQIFQIAVKSRIPLQRLLLIKERQGKKKVLSRFAKGFAQRIQTIVPQQILDRLILTYKLDSLNNKNVQRLVLKLLSIAIKSRITLEQLERLRELKKIEDAKKRIAQGFAAKFQKAQPIVEDVEPDTLSLKVQSNKQASLFVQHLGKTNPQNRSLRKLQNLIHKHVDIVKTQEKEQELQAQAMVETIKLKRPDTFKHPQVSETIKKVLLIAIRSKIPEEDLKKYRNKKVPINVIKNPCVQTFIERLLKMVTTAYQPKSKSMNNQALSNNNSQKEVMTSSDAMKLSAKALQQQKAKKHGTNLIRLKLKYDPNLLADAFDYSQKLVTQYKDRYQNKTYSFSYYQVQSLELFMSKLFEIAYMSKVSVEDLKKAQHEKQRKKV